MEKINRYRTIWISDFHLGTRNTRAGFLLDFLRRNESEYLYLVGDVFDGWALGKSWYWPQLHNDVVQKILRKARKGTRVIYIPGNHDEFAREFTGYKFGGITLRKQAIHQLLDGRQLLVLHGDEFDGIVQYARWLSLLGARAYNLALNLNRWYNHVRKLLNKPYWSLSAYLKQKTKKAVQHIARFEETVAAEAHKYDLDGVVCGHIHHAEIRSISDVMYYNSGDWVESCTALVEELDGTLKIVDWTQAGEVEQEPLPALPNQVEKAERLTVISEVVN